MKTESLMQQVLGRDWDQLPTALQRHHRMSGNRDLGHLDIEYPPFMQGYLNLLSGLGALLNRKGKQLPTQVVKTTDETGQHWQRSIHLEDGRELQFNSRWEAAGDHCIIEYVNSFLGLKMRLRVDNGLHYEGICLILKIGFLELPVPEWLFLGHTSIVETALDDRRFHMDFRLHHPWLGELYRYTGSFHTSTLSGKQQPEAQQPLS